MEPGTVGSPTNSQRGDRHPKDGLSLMVTPYVSLTRSTGDSKHKVRSLSVGVGVCVERAVAEGQGLQGAPGASIPPAHLGARRPPPPFWKRLEYSRGFYGMPDVSHRGAGGCGLRPLVCTRVWTIC